LVFFPSASSSSSALGFGRFGVLSLTAVFALLCDVDAGGEWRAWPLRVVGIVERVDGMLASKSMWRWAAMGWYRWVGDKRCGGMMVVEEEA
jgi:hypothetical protein